MTCVYVCVCVSACKSKWFPMKHDWIRPEKPFENRKCCGRAVGETALTGEELVGNTTLGARC